MQRGECGLDLKGFIALGYLEGRGYQPAELADAMQMTHYEVSRLLGELETKGYVQRLRDIQDGRQVNVQLRAYPGSYEATNGALFRQMMRQATSWTNPM